MATGEYLTCNCCGQFEDHDDTGRCPYCGDYAPRWASYPEMDNFSCPFCKVGTQVTWMTRRNLSSVVEFYSTCDKCGYRVHGFKPEEPKPVIPEKPSKRWYKFW